MSLVNPVTIQLFNSTCKQVLSQIEEMKKLNPENKEIARLTDAMIVVFGMYHELVDALFEERGLA